MTLFKRRNEESTIVSASTIPSVATRDQIELANSILSSVSTQSSFSDIINTVSAANAATISEQPCRANKSNLSPKSMTYKCICCGIDLKVPLGLLYFKCSICDTFHDKRIKNTSTKHTHQLTLEMVEKAVEKDKLQHKESVDECKKSALSYPNLEALLISTLSSADVLNQSFSLGLTKLSYSRPDIDFERVLSFYTLIDSLNSERVWSVLLKTVLSLLKHPQYSMDRPDDIYYLLIIFELPVLNSHLIFSNKKSGFTEARDNGISSTNKTKSLLVNGLVKNISFKGNDSSKTKNASNNCSTPAFSGLNDDISKISLEILERLVAILSHAPKRVRHYLLNWISRYPLIQFQSKVELINTYITHMLTEISSLKASTKSSRAFSLLDNICLPTLPKLDVIPGSSDPPGIQFDAVTLEPEESRTLNSQDSSPHDTTSDSNFSSSKRKRLSSTVKVNSYGKNWKISSFAILQAIYFNANIITQKVPISTFYNTMVDYIDIRADFDAWEQLGVPMSMPSMQTLVPSTVKPNGISSQFSWEKILFAFCEYPFFLSMGTKINILEYDARRQMAHKAHEAFFHSLDTHIPQQLYLHICVRRSHILQDSFQIFEAQENDLKKGIRVKFVDEPGIDVGGLKKEWFLLLTRELFSEELGLFKTEEDSGYNWFKTGSNKPLKYYKLTGVVLGLALYNSTILETNFPPVVFKKLLGASATLDDFKVIMPSYGRSLQMLLDYTGDDFEDTFHLFFEITSESDGATFFTEELIPNGSNIPVTKKNRHDYVKRVVAFHMESSIKRQFEPLKQGFYKVAASNSLALFQPEEIELLINGSHEPIDVDALRAVTQYKHWLPRYSNPDQDVQVVKWFWKYFKSLEPHMQRKLLMFVTGSDRIPATGIVTMSFTITRYGGDSDRFPISHTCFNELCLYEYSSKQKLVNMLSRAINESQGFGLK